MNFYLDFEATQYSNRIISIGCMAENGEKFNTFVKPVNNEKVGKYITELTGITEEMVADAPTADEAFLMFYEWFMMQDVKLPTFYVYGPDLKYIESTIKYMDDKLAIMFANSIKACLVDYSKIVTKYLSRKSIALRSLVAMINAEEVVQRHDALEDAEWLKLVADNLDKIPIAQAVTTIPSQPAKKTSIISEGPFPNPNFVKLKYEPAHISALGTGKKAMWKNLADDSFGTKNDWTVRVWDDSHEAFFRNPEDAVYWSLKSKTTSIKDPNICFQKWGAICNAARKGTKHCFVFWEIKTIEQKEEVKE